VTIFASLKKMVKLPRTLFFLFLVLWFAWWFEVTRRGAWDYIVVSALFLH
jgi:hypothetical protein